MGDPDRLQQLESRLEDFRKRAMAGLAERASELDAAREALEAGQAEAVDEVRRCAHRLRGIAGTIGLADLGQEAGRLEDAARSHADVPTLAAAALDLARKMRSAQSEQPPSAQKANVQPAREAAPEPSSVTAGLSVLAIDDDASTRRLLELTLNRVGRCDARVVAEAPDAISALREKSFALVIVDAMMPDANGLELYREVRTIGGSDPVVVILSAASADELGWELPSDPKLHWLRKPFRPGALIERLSGLLPPRPPPQA